MAKSSIQITLRTILVVTLLVISGAGNGKASGPASGQPVRGLQLSVNVESATWTLGADIAFEATLTNVGNKPYLLDLFGDVDEIYKGKKARGYLPSCWALSWSPSVETAGQRRGQYTLSPDQFHRLLPGESFTKRLNLKLSGVSPGAYIVKLAYVPRAAGSSFSFPDNWEAQHDFHDTMWIGMAFSNPMTIEVVEEAPSPQARISGILAGKVL